VEQRLKKIGIRVSLTEANETLGKRIREMELQKIPYILVVGEKEETSKTVNIRTRGKKETETKLLDEFMEELKKKIEEKK
jgi:threonyl-tRNA synthetase